MDPKLLHASCDQKLPSFIVQNLESNTQSFYSIGNPQFYNKCRINELHGRRIRGCFHGWVILSNNQNNSLWSLWNPLTSNLIHLPPLPLSYKGIQDTYQCCLSSPPDADGSVFLLLSPPALTILVCALDSKTKTIEWTETSYAKQLESIRGEDNDCFLYCPTCCNGKLYAIAMSPISFLIELDIVVLSEQVVVNLVRSLKIPSIFPSPNDTNVETTYPFLKGSCTDLFYIQVNLIGQMVDDVYFYKLDMSSMMWKEMVDFQDAVFFIQFDEHLTCYYSSAVGSEFGGYIHIHYGPTSDIIHSFYVRNRTISLSSMSFPVPESQAYTCAMLECRLEVDHAECKQEEHAKDTQIVARPVKGGDKTVSDSATSESHLLDMPLDILELITKYCTGVEYMKFRATCKQCYLASPSIQWSNKTMLGRLNCCSLVSPWLMVLDRYRDTITFIDPLFGDKYFIKIPQELRDDKYGIYCSRYGWLLMYKGRGEERLVFFNPFTSQIIELPRVLYLQSFCFSAPPSSLDCMVVGFSPYGSGIVFINFVNQGSVWYEYGLDFDDDPYSYQFSAFSGRDIYTLCNNGTIEAFRKITRHGYSREYVAEKGPSSLCKSPPQYFLSVCDQHLLLIIVGELGESVEVFNINQSTRNWEKIDDLGKHMIFISKTSCICLEAASPEMGNKIYFPRSSHDKDTKIVFYSLETCRHHTFDDKIIQESFGADFFGTKCHNYPHTWIQPSW